MPRTVGSWCLGRQLHHLCRFLDSQPDTSAWSTTAREVCRHYGPVNAIPFGKLVDTHSAAIIVYEAVDLRGVEKGLKVFNPPNHGTREPFIGAVSGR